MKVEIIDENIKLIPYYPNYDISYEWYQDPVLCKQVDNIDYTYTREMLEKMYNYLSTNGDCYYIEYKGKLIGEISLHDENKLSIVISKGYQNKHIGRKCVKRIIELAQRKGLKELRVNIYSFNIQSRKMFESAGFKNAGGELYIYEL